MSDTVPEWLHVGAKVAEWNLDGRSGRLFRLTTVERIGKRDVVLANGSRYNVNRLHNRSDAWSPSWQLRSATDPDVVKAQALARRRNTATRLSARLTMWAETGDNDLLYQVLYACTAVAERKEKS